MRCLLVSDLHYTLKQFDWVHAVAERFDAIVLAGDHLDISATLSVDAQIVVILKYIQRIAQRTRVIVASGNHDLTARNAGGERVAGWMARVRDVGAATDGDCVVVGGTTITVCPWWDGPAACAEVGAQLARDAARRGDRWIWVYHAPPDASPVSWAGHRHFGDAELSRWIGSYQPDMVLTGHIHQSPFRAGGSWIDRIGSTWVFNAGRQIGPCPAHVVLDLGSAGATWSSLAGQETVRLDAPFTRPAGGASPP